MLLLDSTSLDSMYNVQDFLASQSFGLFSRSMLKCKVLRFLDLQLPSYSNDFKTFIPFSNLLDCSVAI